MTSKKVEPYIIGVGKALPGDPIGNDRLIHRTNLDVSIEWVDKKIKIKTRHTSKDYPDFKKINKENTSGKTYKDWFEWGIRKEYRNSELSAKAAKLAMENAKIKPNEIDVLIHSSCTPDYPVPSTASIVQDILGIKNCTCFDIRSACCGVMQAYETACAYIQSKKHKTVLIIGMDVGTVFGKLNSSEKGFAKSDTVNALMIGDGGGACVIRGYTDTEVQMVIKNYPQGIFRIEHSLNGSIGVGKEPGMYLPSGGSIYPPGCKRAERENMNVFKHNFRAVLKHGPVLFLNALKEICLTSGNSFDDIDLFVPHQANGSLQVLGPKIGLPKERLFDNFRFYGNTANGSTYICLYDILHHNSEQNKKFRELQQLKEGEYKIPKLKNGAKVIIVSGESTKWLYGAVLLRYISKEGGDIGNEAQGNLVGKFIWSVVSLRLFKWLIFRMTLIFYTWILVIRGYFMKERKKK